MQPTNPASAATVAESAWQYHQKLAQEEYVGYEPDLYQLRSDLMALFLLVHTLAGGQDGNAS